jgi:hypothetical protein
MINKIPFCLLLLNILSFQVYSQQKFQLVDDITKEPVSYAHVYFQNTNKGVVSNSQGYFSLDENTITSDNNIIIQHVAYDIRTISKNELKGLTSIELIKKSVLLSDIVVINRTAKSIVLEALESFQIAHLDKSIFQTYYREYVTRNNEYVKYADGLVNYHVSLKKNNLNFDSEIIQSRSHDLAEEEKFDIDIISPIDLKKIISYNVISEFGKFLKHDKIEDYVFELEFDKSVNPDYYEIIVNPKEGSEKMRYNAKILIEKSDFTIHEIAYESDSTLKDYFKEMKLLGMSIKLTNSKGFIQFSKSNKGTYLSYGKMSVSMHMETKNNKIDQDNEFVSEVMVNDLTYPNTKVVYSNYKKKSLYKNGNQFDHNFWESSKSMSATSKEDLLINKLIEKNNLK